MNFAIEHPMWFLGICAALALNGYRVWVKHQVTPARTAVVLPFPPEGPR